MLRLTQLPLAGACLVESTPLEDPRGCFARLYCQRELEPVLEGRSIVQSNYSFSRKKGTVRGLHYQRPPSAEIKLVRCIQGAIYDVMVDLRKGSPTYLQWHGEMLKAGDLRMILVPEGFAHGLQTLEDDSTALYLHTEYYSPEHESGVRYNDPAIGIRWPLPPVDVSPKDEKQPLISSGFEGITL